MTVRRRHWGLLCGALTLALAGAALADDELPSPAPVEPREKLSQADIMLVVLTNKPALVECVNESVRRAPEKTGVVVLRWSIAISGETRDVKLVSEEKKDTPFSQCAIALIQRWRFPPHRVQGDPVKFPFKVSPPRRSQ